MMSFPQLIRSLLPVLAIGLFTGGWPVAASGVEFIHTNQFVVGEGEEIASETWVSATELVVEGTARNDLFGIATSNRVSGSISQDLWLGGDTVLFTGEVGDDARLAGRLISVEGAVQGDLLVAGETIRVAGQDAVVNGSATLMGGEVVCEGQIQGPLRIMAQRVTLGGDIREDVKITATEITVLRGTRIGGDLVYQSAKELFLDESVILDGNLVRQAAQATESAWPSMFDFLLQLGLLLGSMAVGIPFLALFPAYTGRAVQAMRYRAWRCVLTGLLAVVVLPILILFSAVSLFGAPLALVLTCALVLLAYIGKIVVALRLGGLLLRRRGVQTFGQALLTLVIGLLLIYGGTALPVIGGTLWLAVVILGVGSLLVALFRQPGPPAPPDTQPGA